MAKIFNVEQLRLNNILLTGNNAGELWYNETRLATGGSAVPLTRVIEVGDGLSYDMGGGTWDQDPDLSQDLFLKLLTDGTSIDFNSQSPSRIRVTPGGVTWSHLSTAVAGAGLAGGNTAPLSVTAGSGIQVSNDAVNIAPLGVTGSMIQNLTITEGKLQPIETNGKVVGSAVTLEDTVLHTGASKGLTVNANSISKYHLATNVAGAGLAGGNNFALDVGAGSGLLVDATNVNIAVKGITGSMIDDLTIGEGKLQPIETNGKVIGSAVTLKGTTLGTGDNAGLMVKDGGITATQLNTSVAGAGLVGGGGTALYVNSGSGIVVKDDKVHIAETGIVNSMIANGTISEGKLDPNLNLPASKMAFTYGDGIAKSVGDELSVDLHATRPGLEFGGGKLRADDTVVRADDQYGSAGSYKMLSGFYQFKENVLFDANVTITGNLEIRGDTTITQSNEVEIGDSVIRLNAGYSLNSAPDAGFEIERGGTLDHAWMIFDDDATDRWVAGVSNNGSYNLHRLETQEFNRSYHVEITSGISDYKLPFNHWVKDNAGANTTTPAFPANPVCVVSLEHTGKYHSNNHWASQPLANPELLGVQVREISRTGVHVSFSANTPHSGYYLCVHASDGFNTDL